MGRERIALAADLPLPQAQALYERVRAHVGTVKVGLSLFVEHGPAAVRAFVDAGAKVFLDLKLHDIPNTVELAAQRAGALGVNLLTIHAAGGASMIQAAAAGAKEGARSAGVQPPRVLAVTVLTSLGPEDLQALGWDDAPEELALRWARLAAASGADGVVCSAKEVAKLRAALGPSFFLCTPGIRPSAGAGSRDDQARAETAGFAARAGSDLLVVGRPIYQATDPVRAAAALVEEVTAA